MAERTAVCGKRTRRKELEAITLYSSAKAKTPRTEQVAKPAVSEQNLVPVKHETLSPHNKNFGPARAHEEFDEIIFFTRSVEVFYFIYFRGAVSLRRK